MAKVKISELPSLSPATLDTTFVVGISGSTTYKISINQLTSSLDTTFATDLVTAALSSSLNSKLSTSSYSTDSASFNSRIISGSVVAGTISGSSQISALGFVTGSYTTINSFNSLTQSFNSISQSFSVISGSVGTIDFSTLATTSSNTFIGNQTISGSIAISQGIHNWEFGSDGIIKLNNGYGEIYADADSGSVRIGTAAENVAPNAQIILGGFNQVLKIKSGPPLREWTFEGNGDFNLSGSINGVSNLTTTASFNTFTQSYYSASASFDSRVDSLENATSSYLTSLNGAISSSTQVLNGSGIFSSSAQLPTGLISGSSQVLNSSGIFSSSAQLPNGLISSSTQLPSNLISGSSQISTLGFITGSYISSSSYNADSASFDTRINSITLSSGSNLTYLLEAYANVTYTLPGGFTEDPCRYSVVSATENVPSNWFNTSTYRFTPQKAGYWEINAAYDVYRNTEASMAIRKNGSIVASAGSFNAVAQDISKIIYLNGSTDYIDIVNTGGAALQRNQYQQRSWFQAKFVGNISGSTDLPAGVISGSSQLTSSFDTRYALSASFVSSSNVSSIQTITSASYAAITPVSGTLYIIIG